MRSSIKQKLDTLRAHGKIPLAYNLRPGKSPARVGIDVPTCYLEILAETNGAIFGDMSLSDAESLDEQNGIYRLRYGAIADEFFVFGEVIWERLVIQRATDMVFRVAEMFTTPDEAGVHQPLVPFDEFIDDFVLGPRYAELTVDLEEDPWWNLMRELGFRKNE